MPENILRFFLHIERTLLTLSGCFNISDMVGTGYPKLLAAYLEFVVYFCPNFTELVYNVNNAYYNTECL